MKKLLTLLVAIALLCSVTTPVFAADKAVGTTIRLQDTTGTVSVLNAAGKAQTVRKDMRLYNGYTVATGAGSSAFVSLDSTKAIKLGASSKVQLKKAGNQLEVTLLSGNLYFDVAEPLKTDERLNIRTSTMVTGVRGSSGWVKSYEMGMLHGHAQVTCHDLRHHITAVYDAFSGEGVYHAPDAHPSNFIKRDLTNSDVPLVAVEALAADPELQAAITKDVPNLDVPTILDQEEPLRRLYEEMEKEIQRLLDELDSNLGSEDENGDPAIQVFQPDPAPTTRPGTGSGGTQPTPVTPDEPTPVTHTVTFDYHDETTKALTMKVKDGETVARPDDPVRKGYTFDGWYLRDNAFDFATPITADITLDAWWTVLPDEPETSFTVTFDPGNGEDPFTRQVVSGETVEQPEDPAKEGYTFLGWYLEGEETPFDFSTPITEETFLIAHWEIRSFTVRFFLNEGDEAPYATQEVEYGGFATRPETDPV